VPATGDAAQGERRSILHVVQKFSSGVGSAIAQYTQSVPELDHHLLSGTAVDAEGDLADQARFTSVHRMEGSVRAKVRQIREVVRQLRPDVVHAHSSHGGAYVRLAVPRADTYLVYTPHCYAFERLDVGLPTRAALWAAEALLAVNTSAFAACSSREWALSAWRTHRAPRYLVPNIAPPAAAAPRPRRARAAPAPQWSPVAAGSVRRKTRCSSWPPSTGFGRCVRGCARYGSATATRRCASGCGPAASR
jgi:hypothetical protein